MDLIILVIGYIGNRIEIANIIKLGNNKWINHLNHYADWKLEKMWGMEKVGIKNRATYSDRPYKRSQSLGEIFIARGHGKDCTYWKCIL